MRCRRAEPPAGSTCTAANRKSSARTRSPRRRPAAGNCHHHSWRTAAGSAGYNTYNIGGFNEWKNIDIIKVVIRTVDRLLGRKEGEDIDLITYVTDRAGHDLRYAIDSSKLQKELGWEPSLQFEEGIEKTVKWYLENEAWMDNITSGEYEKYYESQYKD